MERFTTLDALACPLGLENVDTDQLIPARFMSRPRSQGYGQFLLHDLRFGSGGEPLGFLLDQPRYKGAEVIVARRNFGTGSSREAAVYALWDFGIRCVIAPSFGDIFASNAVKNGLLPAQVSPEDAEALIAALEAAETPRLRIDLAKQTITVQTIAGQKTAMQTIAQPGSVVSFAIDPVRKLQLLNGWDDLDLTRRHMDEIAAFRARRRKEAPWVFG